jgi:plastocyanin
MTTLPPASTSAVPRSHPRTGWTNRLARGVVAGVVAALVLGACGGSGSNDATSRSAAAPTTTATGPTGVPATTGGASAAGVTVKQFQFMPAELVVKAGTTVTWVNCEPETGESHTSTSDANLWDSPFLPPGASYSRTFGDVGRFDYSCIPHPFMHGVVVVE